MFLRYYMLMFISIRYFCLAVVRSEDIKLSRILQGETVSIHDYPHYAHIIIREGFCGGAIVKRDTILTSAHCLENKPVSLLKVTVGLDRSPSNTYFPNYEPVKWTKIHPKYRLNPDFDIGIVKLRNPIRFHSFAKPIRLSKRYPKVGSEISVVGYGGTKCDKSRRPACYDPSDSLRLSRRTVFYYNNVTMTSFSSKSSTCDGDSGSPVSIGRCLIAVHTASVQCDGLSIHVPVAHREVYSFLVKYIREK